MTDADFLPVILADPGDDAPRLVYADWLDEHGDNAGRLRAEFIRVQCELARREAAHLPPGDPCTCTRTDEDFRRYRQGTYCAACRRRNGPIEALRHRERELLDLHRGDWFRLLSRRPGFGENEPLRWWPVASNERERVERGPDVPILSAAIEGRPVRGFVERLAMTADDCLRHLDAVRRVQPVRHVTLTTRPRFEFHAGHPSAVRLIDAPRRLTLPVYSDYLTAEAEKKLLELTWQGVTFGLPPCCEPVAPTHWTMTIGDGPPMRVSNVEVTPDPRPGPTEALEPDPFEPAGPIRPRYGPVHLNPRSTIVPDSVRGAAAPPPLPAWRRRRRGRRPPAGPSP